MAANLVRAGYSVTGFDVTPGSVERLVQAGGASASSLEEATANSDVVITMLPDSPQVREVVLGPGGVLACAGPDLLLIDMSTIAPETSVAVAEQARERGTRVLDAPVSGGEQGRWRQPSPSWWAASPRSSTLRVLSWSSLARRSHTSAALGPARRSRLPTSSWWPASWPWSAKRSCSWKPPAWRVSVQSRVLAGGLAGNRILDRKAASMLAREFAPGFRIDLHHKDMGIALASARSAQVSLPVTGLVAQLVTAARTIGYGPLDHSALLKVVEKLSGREQ